MAGINIKIDDSFLERLLHGVEERLSNRRELMEKLGFIGLKRMRKNIVSGNFRGLSGLTKRVKKGNKPLQDTGILLNSLLPGRKGNVFEAGRDDVRVGTAIKYAAIQHFGGGVQARNARNLAIPLFWKARQEARKKGVRRVVEERGLEFTMRRRTKFLGKREGNRWVLWYLLKGSIEIPARPFADVSGAIPEMEEITRRYIFGL